MFILLNKIVVLTLRIQSILLLNFILLLIDLFLLVYSTTSIVF